ncbi:hypothetical protein L1049_005617 [Liquidambar formosana]|uniref:X8 domain-containing protein n=1 Tax=Liquidambar formosana TaxID=63359 RepID=A0AAP0WRU3_LIQFO
MAVLVCFVMLFLALTGHSSATYCICKDGVGDSSLQKALDYACGAGADCSAILQTGSCYQPNTVKDHCSYAVNSYFQKKGQVQGSCDFSGAATTSATLPTVASGCVYQSTPSTTTGGTTTPSTTPTTTPSTTTPSTTTPSTTTPSTTTPSTTPSVFGSSTGLGPTGSGITDNSSAAVALLQNVNLFCSLALTLWISGFLLWGGR